MAPGIDPFPKDYVWTVAAAGYALTAASAGLSEHARVVYERLVPYEGQLCWGGSITLGLIDQALGEAARTIGDLTAADRHFGRALRQAELWQSPVFEAHARLGLAHVARDRGRTATAAELASAVASIAAEHDLAGLLRSAGAVAAEAARS